jgi:hypothetical protein
MPFILILLLAQHVVISARAGLVTYAEGVVSVPASTHVGEGNILQTGPSGRAEVLLQADAYLRVRPYSGIRLVSESLDTVEVELTGGAALVEIREIEENFPITVRLAGLEVRLRREGVYLFEPERVAVLEGELDYGAERLGEGRSLVRSGETFAQARNGEDLADHDLVEWSDRRSDTLSPNRVRRPRPFRF